MRVPSLGLVGLTLSSSAFAADVDGDGLQHYAEAILGTSDNSVDSDGDGVRDNVEAPADDILRVSVDNAIVEIYVDGVALPLLANAGTWMAYDSYNLALKPGNHVIAIKGDDFGSVGGVMATLVRGSTLTPLSGTSAGPRWKGTASAPPSSWTAYTFDDAAWVTGTICPTPGRLGWLGLDGRRCLVGVVLRRLRDLGAVALGAPEVHGVGVRRGLRGSVRQRHGQRRSARRCRAADVEVRRRLGR